MFLADTQKKAFYEQGYLKIPGVVPRVMVEQALRTINHSLGEEGMNKEDLPTLRVRSYCKEAREDRTITGLLNESPLFAIAEELIGEGNVQRVTGGQIALQFPRDPRAEDPPPPRGHIDGLGSGMNGGAKGTYRRGFTALAVVLLSRLDRPYAGNFTVWPQSHRFFEDHFKHSGHDILANGMPQVELPEKPVMITGQPGDAILSHHLLVHAAAPNTSPDIRYAVVFRLRHKECEQFGLDAFTDAWHEWPGVRQVVGAS